MAQAGTIFVNVRLATAELQAGIERSQKQLRRFGRKMSSIGSDFTRNISLPLAAAGGASLKFAVDFESAFTGVRKTVDGSEADFKKLRKGILDMSKDLPSSATEIAAVAEAAGQLGIKTNDILGFTRVMIDLGETTNLSANEAATALARFANINKTAAQDYSRLGSVIVDLGNNMATTEAEIVSFGSRLAGAGVQIGLSEAEILSFGAALSSVGINAEAGGTAFSRVFKDIQLAVEKGGEKLESFAEVAGVSIEQFSKDFSEKPATAIQKFIEGFIRIKQEGGSVLGTLEALKLDSIRVSDSLLRSANAGNLLGDALQIGSQAWQENSALTKEATLRYSTLESELKKTYNTLKVALLPVGEALMPVLRGVANVVKDLSESFSKLSPKTQKFVLIFGGIAAATGPILIALGSLATLIGSTLVLKIGLATAAIASLVAGFATIPPEAITGAKFLKGELSRALQQVGDMMKSVASIIKTSAAKITSYFKGMFEGAKTYLVDRFESAVVKPVKQKIEKVTGFFAQMYDAVVGNSWVPDMIVEVGNWFEQLDDRMVKPAEAATDAVESSFEGLSGTMSGFMDDYSKVLAESEKIIDRFGESSSGSAALSDLLGVDLNTSNSIEAALNDAFAQAIQGGELDSIISNLTSSIGGQLGGEIGSAVGAAAGDVLTGSENSQTWENLATNVAASLATKYATTAITGYLGGSTSGAAAASSGAAGVTAAGAATTAGAAAGAALYTYQAYQAGNDLFSGDTSREADGAFSAALLAGGFGWADLALDALGVNISAGKDPDQLNRDVVRDRFEETGLTQNNKFQLATGGFGDIGTETFNVDPSQFSADTVALTNAITDAIGLTGKLQEDFAGLFANAIMGFGESATEVENFNGIILNAQGLMADLGLTAEQGKASLQEAFLAGTISIEEFQVGIQSFNRLAQNAFETVGQAIDLFATKIGPDSPPQEALSLLQEAFKKAGETGKNQFDAVRKEIVNRFGPEAGAEFDRLRAAGITSFEDFQNASADQIFVLFDVISKFSQDSGSALASGIKDGASEVIDALRQIKNEAENTKNKVNQATNSTQRSGEQRFALGGVVNGPTRALIGEAGPEAVVPLSGGRTIPVSLNGNLGSESPSIIYNIDARGAKPGVDRQIIQALQATRKAAVRDAVEAVHHLGQR